MVDVSHQIALLIERLPIAVALLDASGNVLGKAGQLSGLLGSVIPSRDPDAIKRWQFTDRGGAIIPPTEWPSARALRGEIIPAGMTGRFQNDGEHRIRVISIPVKDAGSEIAAITFLQQIDRASRSSEGSQKDLEHKFLEALVKSIMT